jgi:hypothetical protein
VADGSGRAHGPGEGRGGSSGKMDRKNPKKLTFRVEGEDGGKLAVRVDGALFAKGVTLTRRAEAWEGRGDDQ